MILPDLYTYDQAIDAGLTLPTVAELQAMTDLDPERFYWSCEPAVTPDGWQMGVFGTGNAVANSKGSLVNVAIMIS